jgi:transposase InsO family protein
MAEAFVKTFKRDYARVSPRPDAASVLRQLDSWFEHHNRMHPHKALGYRSPREFRSGVDRMAAQRPRRRSGQARQPRIARWRATPALTRAHP